MIIILQGTTEDKKYYVGMSSVRFQLTEMGHHLHREERTDPDPRVSNFIPDTWQVSCTLLKVWSGKKGVPAGSRSGFTWQR